jgi:hypothetical protein
MAEVAREQQRDPELQAIISALHWRLAALLYRIFFGTLARLAAASCIPFSRVQQRDAVACCQ